MILSGSFDSVHSVEIVEQASQDARKNAAKNGITNMEFYNGKAELFVQEFQLNHQIADTVIIDPPRDGMHASGIPAILAIGAKEVIYVSCNPSTLVRDLQLLLENGEYALTDVTPVDMFPHTHHIETVARLDKKTA